MVKVVPESRIQFEKRGQLFIRAHNERFPSSRCASAMKLSIVRLREPADVNFDLSRSVV
jgi:hypothetical protein